MHRWILAALVFAWALPALAAEGDFLEKVGTNQSYYVSNVLCETASIGTDCAEFPLLTASRSLPDRISVKLELESGGACSVVVKGRDVTGQGAVTLGTLTSAGTSEEEYRGHWKFVYATISGTCTAIDVRIKRVWE